MEDKGFDIYTSYNSTITDGRRVRKMRRTQLSAQKILSRSLRKGEHGGLYRLKNLQSVKRSNTRSQPKIEPKNFTKDKSHISKEFAKKNIQNQYYVKIPHTTSQQKDISKASLKSKASQQNKLLSDQQIVQQKSFLSIAKSMRKQLEENSRSNLINESQENNGKDSKLKPKSTINDYQLQPEPSTQKLSQRNSNQKTSQYNLDISKSQNTSKISNKKQNASFQKSKEVEPIEEKEISGFEDIGEDFGKHLKEQFVELKQNFSKFKVDNLENPIINSSSPKKEGWKDAIKTLTELSQLDNSSFVEAENKGNSPTDTSKKYQLKIESLREDNLTQAKIDTTQKNSWKHLPLTSKQPKSFESLSQRAEPGSLKQVLESIQIHDYLVTLVSQFRDQIQKFPTSSTQKEILCFLLEKKHFLQKNNMLKALKGSKNIFYLSSIQIPSEHLHKYLQTPQIQKIVKEIQSNNRDLFKNLEKSYLDLKQRYRNNPYLKLQTPYDNFSKEIVRILAGEVTQLYKILQNTGNDSEQQNLQNEIFDTIQMIFLISEMNGRKVKKFEFYDDIDDFEDYYRENERTLKQTIQYFQNLK